MTFRLGEMRRRLPRAYRRLPIIMVDGMLYTVEEALERARMDPGFIMRVNARPSADHVMLEYLRRLAERRPTLRIRLLGTSMTMKEAYEEAIGNRGVGKLIRGRLEDIARKAMEMAYG